MRELNGIGKANRKASITPDRRVFVNRTIRLEKIQFFGFDMDYTLAVYKSPQMEIMTFKLIVEKMIAMGYPAEFRNFEYDPVFPVRGLWFDFLYGNLLKVDAFGNILVALHGFHFMTGAEIEQFYPNKFIHLTANRIYVLNTLFNLPETYLIACVVDYFEKSKEYTKNTDKTGLKCGEMLMSYKSISQDIRSAVDWAHFDSDMKRIIVENLDHYIEKDERLELLMTQLRVSGRKTFLLTNSDYAYTNALMNYLLGPKWATFFDITVVDARKPLWFAEGTVFREVNTQTGALKIGIHTGPLREGSVYSGGSCDAFRRLVKARGKDVLYVGDHIFGDVLRSKKSRGWRTFLVVPELNHELAVWTGKGTLFDELKRLDVLMADLYKNLDANTRDKPEIATVLGSIRAVTNEMEQEYGVLGSLFRSGPRTTFFASQVERYADLYASSCFNLVHYPTFYFFRAPMTLMPHESTVHHTDSIPSDQMFKIMRQESIGQKVRGWNQKMSKSTTICFEEDEEVDGDLQRTQGSSPENSSSRLEKYNDPDPDSIAEDPQQVSPPNEKMLESSTDVVVPNPSYVEDEHH